MGKKNLKDDPDLKAIHDLKLPGEQVEDIMLAEEQALPESVVDKVLVLIEKRAKEAGYDNVDDYLEDHPEGMNLMAEGGLRIDLTDSEQDEMKANKALKDMQDAARRESFFRFYGALVATMRNINENVGDLATVDHEIMRGKPCVKDSRVPVDIMIAMLTEQHEDGQFYTIKDIVEEYDFLSVEDVANALKFATYCVRPKVLAEAMIALGDPDEEE